MINPKRVKRIKSAIYLFILLLFLLPAILFIVLSVKMLQLMPELDRIIAASSQAQFAQAPAQQMPQPSSKEDSLSSSAHLLVPERTSPMEPDDPPERPKPPETSKPSEPPEPPGPNLSAADREDSSQINSSSTATAASGTPLTEPLPEQEVVSPTYGVIQAPNTGLPK